MSDVMHQLKSLLADLDQTDRWLEDLTQAKVQGTVTDGLIDLAESEDYLGQRAHALCKEIRCCTRALDDAVVCRLNQERDCAFRDLCAIPEDGPAFRAVFGRVLGFDRRIRERARLLIEGR